MALIACPECGKQVSNSAPACPNCGAPIAQMTRAQAQAQTAKKEADESKAKRRLCIRRHRHPCGDWHRRCLARPSFRQQQQPKR
jgi:hypothetical protein